MTTLEQSLALIDKAEALQQDILQALAQGDCAGAEALGLKHQRIIESIAFTEFDGEMAPALLEALQRLKAGNDQLVATTTGIQQEISQQLNTVQKGIVGSRIYQDIDSQP